MKIKVGNLVRLINRHNSTVYDDVYVVIARLTDGLWLVATVSDLDYTRVFHTNMMEVVICK